MEFAPIILFAYNRPEHTKKTLLSLQQNFLSQQSVLFIFIDGPKPDASVEQKNKIQSVKQIATEQQWCAEVHIIESQKNKGLALSVTEGVTDIINRYGKVIVLEDDHLTDKWFLKFMNDGLSLYQNDKDVACISGYIYPVDELLPETFFMKGADCWGWATWKRGWDIFDTDGPKLLNELKNKELESDFNFNNTYPYVQMLEDQINRKNNSWAILWYASAYLKNKFTLYPGKSLVHNIGVDGSGIHSAISNNFDTELRNVQISVEHLNVEESVIAKKAVSRYFKKIYAVPGQSIFQKILLKLKSLV